MKYFVSILLLTYCLSLQAQEIEFFVELSNDSIMIGNTSQLKFTILNGNGDFQAPSLEGLDVVAGPNVASSFSFVNGQSSQEMSYTYIIQPSELGTFTIPMAALVTDNGTIQTEEIQYMVVANPDGILQEGGQLSSRGPRLMPQQPMELDKVKPKKNLRRI